MNIIAWILNHFTISCQKTPKETTWWLKFKTKFGPQKEE